MSHFSARQDFTALVLGLLLTLASSAGAAQQPASSKAGPLDVEQLLRELGIADAIAQTDQIIAQSVAAIQPRVDAAAARQVHSTASLSSLSGLLSDSTGKEAIAAATSVYLAEHLPANVSEARRILDSALVIRARNFDVSLEMDGAFEKFVEFRTKLESQPAAEARVNLVRRLDTALFGSAIAAVLQTEIEITVETLAMRMAGSSLSTLSRADKLEQRQRHMAGIAADLHLFSYRFMQDRELEQYVELMEQNSIQQLLSVSLQGMQQALQASRAVVVDAVSPPLN